MQKMNAYVECMLGLQREEIGDVLSATLLSKVINLLSDLDVSFRLSIINCFASSMKNICMMQNYICSFTVGTEL